VTTASEASDQTAIPILEIGRTWMSDPATAAIAGELGLPPGFGFWVHGRAGVLGDVHADVAASALGIMAPDLVAKVWAQRPEQVPARDIAAAFARAAADWGRRTFVDVDDADLDRLSGLGQSVVDAALPVVGALFAGWRTMDAPADAAGRATHVLQVLREMRGGAHLSAIQSVGLTPEHAIMSFTADQVRGGTAGAERFGWTPPHPQPDEPAKAQAEIATTAACVHAYEALTEAERTEFVDLVDRVRSTFP